MALCYTQDTRSGCSYPSAEMQSVYSTVPVIYVNDTVFAIMYTWENRDEIWYCECLEFCYLELARFRKYALMFSNVQSRLKELVSTLNKT